MADRWRNVRCGRHIIGKRGCGPQHALAVVDQEQALGAYKHTPHPIRQLVLPEEWRSAFRRASKSVLPGARRPARGTRSAHAARPACFRDVAAGRSPRSFADAADPAPRTPGRNSDNPCSRRPRRQSPTRNASRAAHSRDDKDGTAPGRPTDPSRARAGTGGVSVGRSPALPPPGNQQWHSRTEPMAPARISSTMRR